MVTCRVSYKARWMGQTWLDRCGLEGAMRLYGTVTEAAGQHRWKVKVAVDEEEKISSKGQLRLEEAGAGELDGDEDEEGYDPEE